MVRPASLTVVEGSGVRRRFDAVSWLTIYLVVLYAVPSRLVIGPLGSAGAPSMLLGLGSFGIWLLAHIGTARRTRMHPEPVRISLAIFMIFVGISYALAMSRPISRDEVSPADVALLSLLSWSGALLVTHDGIPTRSRMETLAWRLAAGGGLLAALGAVQFVTKRALVDQVSIPGLTAVASIAAYTRDGRIRPSGTAIHPLEYGTILAILLPIALHVAFHHRSKAAFLRWLPALAIGGVIAISSSRAAYMSAALAVLVCAIGWSRRQRLVVLGLGAAGTVGLAALAPNLVQSVLNLFAGAEKDPSIASRTDSFSVASSFLVQHPFFGRGLGTFLPKYRIFDNQYLLLLVTVGLLGTLAFVGILIAALARLISGFLATKDPTSRDLTVSVAGSLVSGFVSLAFFDAFAFPMTMGTIFLCLGLAGAAARLATGRESRARAASERRKVDTSSSDAAYTPASLAQQPRRARTLAHAAGTDQVADRGPTRRLPHGRAACLPEDDSQPEQ
ncbi:O-antigen polymerase [Microlunatus sp. Gsoil 973]|nr:O-antigen polymerase [Microlunatus sp. Gsoil 973]